MAWFVTYTARHDEQRIHDDNFDRRLHRTTFQAFLRDRDEPSWLIDRRREAFARFQAFAWPSARDEEWRRTDIRAFKLDDFAPPCPDQPTGATRTALDGLWETLSSHYATGIEHVNGAAVRHADPVAWAGRSSST